MELNALIIAKRLLSKDGKEVELQPKLVEFLELIELLCRRGDGKVRSRQVVALAIATYQQLHPTRKLIK